MPRSYLLDTRSGPLPFHQIQRPRLGLVLRLAPPLAGLAALAALGAGQIDRAASAETVYLAFAAGIVLLAAGAVARRTKVPVLGTSAVVALAWIVPAGPARGALVETAAAATLALAAVERARATGAARAVRLPAGKAGELGGPRGAVAALLRPVPALGLALGFQALVRADELLAPPSIAWALIVYVLLPVAGALVVLALSKLEGPLPAALAAAAALVVGPGFRPATVTALAALVGVVVLLGDRAAVESALAAFLDRLSTPGGPGEAPNEGAAGTAGGTLAPKVFLLVKVGAAAVLLAPAVWSPRAALVSALAGAALALHRRPWAAPACAVAAAAAAGVTILMGAARPLSVALPLAAVVPAAVPAMVWPARRRIGLAATALVLAFAAAAMVQVEGALAPAAALAALAVASDPDEGPVPTARAAAALQSTWAALLLAGTALAGSYPWLRAVPLETVLHRLGVATGWPGALVLAAITLAVTLAAGALVQDKARGGARAVSLRSAATAGALAALCLLFHVPRSAAALIDEAQPLVLEDTASSWAEPLGAAADGGSLEASAGATVGNVVIDSALGNAADLAPGTPVATLALRGVDLPERTWTLRVGTETGEWAADRSVRAGAAGPPVPTPWRSWMPEEGRFFGHTYRAVLDVGRPAGAADDDGGPLRADRIELRLRPDLPAGVVLTVFRLEIRP